MLVDVLLILGCYLCGSIAAAIIVCRLMGLPDPRAGGSGNPGATNVLRLGGKRAAALTLAGDVLKGLLPVLALQYYGTVPAVLAMGAVAALLGHLFPIFFRFQGGKGVATAFGVTIALSWPVALAMGITWLAVAAAFRFSSLGSLMAIGLAPLFAWVLAPHPANIIALTTMAVLLCWRHSANIKRLLNGTESRIGQQATPPPP